MPPYAVLYGLVLVLLLYFPVPHHHLRGVQHNPNSFNSSKCSNFEGA